jgi:hypothetical protein
MAPDIRKTAEAYVKQQVQAIGDRVPQKDVKQAIKKVAEALQEMRTAAETSNEQMK